MPNLRRIQYPDEETQQHADSLIEHAGSLPEAANFQHFTKTGKRRFVEERIIRAGVRAMHDQIHGTQPDPTA